MSTSVVHILTVIGKGAKQVEAACESLLNRKVQRNPKSHGSDDWSDQDHKDLADLCIGLIRASRKLPVLYYAQYLDSWSVASSMFWLLKWPDERNRLIYGANHNLAFYPSVCCDEILAQIKKRRRTWVYRNQSEDRWYLDHVKEAIETGLWLKGNFVVVSIDEAIDGSRLDDEIKASLETLIDLNTSP